MFPDPIIVLSNDLTQASLLEKYKNMGYTYIRKVHRPYNYILRSLSVGCIVELSPWKNILSYPINSKGGKKLINRISYFG
jgi:hypothetical protein